MTTKPGEQAVDDVTRDKVFAQIRHQNDNNICLDCEKKNPKWASIHLGIHLCIDCAGKHRQYGVIYSFVKSTNLDTWNFKQMLFMQKGSNARALQYFKKCGVINANNRHIDYKSPVVQNLKAIITQQVEKQLNGGQETQKMEEKKSPATDFFQETTQKKSSLEQMKEIPSAEIVEDKNDKGKKKKEKKKFGAKQINLEGFESIQFDDGVPAQQKEKIVKQYEKQKDRLDFSEASSNQNGQHSGNSQIPVFKQQVIQAPKELSEQQVKKKMEELKQNTKIKAISSESFKDTNIDNVVLKQNLNKFTGSSSISSTAFFNKEEEGPNQTMDKLKGIVSNAGEKLYSKISGYWGKQ